MTHTSLPTNTKSLDFRVNTQYEILTPSGFQKFRGIRKQRKRVCRLEFDDGSFLVATPEHLLLTPDGWQTVKQCQNDTLVCGVEGDTHRITLKSAPYTEWVYDPIEVANGAAYNSGTVVSHNCSFLSTSYTLVRAQVLQSMRHMKPVQSEEDGYQEFIPPDESRTYLMTVDTAAGQGLDYSTFVITDVSQMPYRIVATFANNKVTTMEFPAILMKYAKRYFMPWLMIEVNDIGRDVAHIMIRDFEYPRFMSTATEKRLGQRLTFNSRMQRSLGVRMTAGVKRSGCAVLKGLIEKGQLEINDYRVIQQLSVFVQQGSTFKAQSGFHDDLVMPLVTLGWVSLQPNFAEVTVTRALDTYIDVAKGTKETIHPVELPNTEMPDPVGIFTDFMDDEDPDWLLR